MAARQAPRKYVLVLNAGNVADALVRKIAAWIEAGMPA